MKIDSYRTVTWLVIFLLTLPICSVFGKSKNSQTTTAPSQTTASPSQQATPAKPGGPIAAATAVVIQRVAAVNGEVVVELRHKGKQRLQASQASRIRLKVTAAGRSRQWHLIKADPGLKGLNGGRRLVQVKTGIVVKKRLSVVAELTGGAKQKPVQVWLYPKSSGASAEKKYEMAAEAKAARARTSAGSGKGPAMVVLPKAGKPQAKEGDQADLPPEGTYTQTCTDIQYTPYTLGAMCRANNGYSYATKVSETDRCIDDITNVDGHLTCPKSGPAPPPGTYRNTCINPSVSGSTLSAICRWRTDSGQTRYGNSSIDVAACSGDISNHRGQLTCASSDIPPGPYQASCTNVRVEGTKLIADCTGRDGTRTYRSSIRNWEYCITDIENFSGSLVCQQEGVPDGTYKHSCLNWYIDGDNNLGAVCQSGSGEWRKTTLLRESFSSPDCRDIFNNDARLRCNSNATNAPDGPYLDSCDNAYKDGRTLHARCRRNNGSRQAASLERTDLCTNGITNFNGELFCQHSDAPAGSYRDSCTDAHVTFNGTTLLAICRNTAGHRQSTALSDPQACNGDISNNNGNLTCP